MKVAGTYTVKQLLKYYRHAKQNPEGRILPPGMREHFDELNGVQWLQWFYRCLTVKINRKGGLSQGKGSNAKRRAVRVANESASCKWCGFKTGLKSKMFCSASCARSYS